MAETAKVDKRGRVTIPKVLREAHNIDENTEFIIEDIDDDTFILKKIDLEELIWSVKKEIRDKDLTKLHSEVEEEADEIRTITKNLS
ncbi:MAG: AbrB/MazE/SpoVT family DNA-binding domain-containing protein [Thermoplasmata archaeon]